MSRAPMATRSSRVTRPIDSGALRALAVGALAVGALAIGAVAIGRARIRRLEIDELVVRKLRVTENLQPPPTPRSERNPKHR
jgi:hypothetical protein